MKDTENRRYEMFARARDFGAAHTSAFAPATRGGALFAELNAVVLELEAHATTQSSATSSAQQGTTTKAVARDRLRRQLEAINHTAHALAHDMPGLDDKFRMPRGNNDQNLLHTARAFAADAAPFAPKFIEFELPPSFSADLEAAIADFEQAVSHQQTGTQSHVAATAAIDATIERGMNIVSQLDAIVRNKFSDDAATLAAWQSARHTQRAPRSKPQPADAAPTPANQ